MKILGLNLSHDSSVCFIEDGVIKYAIEEEKLSRIKQDFGWPENAINRLLKEYNIHKNEINIIALDAEIPRMLGENEIKYRFTKSSLKKNLEYINRITTYFKLTSRSISEQGGKRTIERLFKQKGFNNASVAYYGHHLSHAASAYYTAPIECDLIITCDGHGGPDSFNYYTIDMNGLKLIKSNDYKASVGLMYSMVTKLLGFRPTRHEGKITGLAALGKPSQLIKDLKNLFRYNNVGTLERFPFEDVQEYWDRYNLSKQFSLKELINLKTSAGDISLDYGVRAHILHAKLKEVTNGFSPEDIAFACQKVTEEVILNDLNLVLSSFYRDAGTINVALAGGVFANVRCNQKIYEHPKVANVFIHPAMGDSGLALGNAILADIDFRSHNPSARDYAFKHTYLGPDFSKEVESFIKKVQSDDAKTEVVKMHSPSEQIAEILYKNGIVGFWHGRMEWGPRALGSRSIILNTFNRNVNDTLNKRLDRTDFMPFAPSVLDFMAKEYFPAYESGVPAADYMTITYDTDKKYHQLLQAVVHVDGTARPQVVSKKTNPYYYSILEAFHKLTNCGAVVNTSFNAHEEPIVSSPEVAFNALRSGRIDFLVIDDYLIKVN